MQYSPATLGRLVRVATAALTLVLSATASTQSTAVECLKQIKEFVVEKTTLDKRVFQEVDLAMLQSYDFFSKEDYVVDASGDLNVLGFINLGAAYEKNWSRMTEEHRRQFLRLQNTVLTALSVQKTRVGVHAVELLRTCVSDRPPVEVTALELDGAVSVTVKLNAHLTDQPIFLTKVYGMGFVAHPPVKDKLLVGVARTYILAWTESAFAGTVLVEVGNGVFACHVGRLGHEITVSYKVENGLEKVDTVKSPKLRSFDCDHREYDDIPREAAPHGGTWGRADKWLVHKFPLTYTAPNGLFIIDAKGHCESGGWNTISGPAIAAGGKSVRIDVGNWTGERDFWMTVDLGRPRFLTDSYSTTLQNGQCTVRVPKETVSVEILFSMNNVAQRVILKPPSDRVLPNGVHVAEVPGLGMDVYEIRIDRL